jgi:hypothetical protein
LKSFQREISFSVVSTGPKGFNHQLVSVMLLQLALALRALAFLIFVNKLGLAWRALAFLIFVNKLGLAL